MVKNSITNFVNRFRRPSITLSPSPQQEEAVTLFFGGEYDEALQIIDNIDKIADLIEIDKLQSLILKSNIFTEKGDYQKGLELSIKAILRSNEINHSLLLIDSLFAQIGALLRLGELDRCSKVINEVDTVLKKSRDVSKTDKKRIGALNSFNIGKSI